MRNATLPLQHMEVLCYNGLRFEFIKICMGTQRFCWKSQFCLYLVNKIYLPCCCVVFFCLPAPQADLTQFWRVIVRWVSTAKRKTRLHTDFQSARRSKQINPLKITLPTQFLRRITEEILIFVRHQKACVSIDQSK